MQYAIHQIGHTDPNHSSGDIEKEDLPWTIADEMY